MERTGLVAQARHHANSAVGQLLLNLSEGNADPKLRQSVQSVLETLGELAENANDVERPFLTVVMRTQGRKLEAFQDALLTLYGQSVQDFELLIMAHEVDAEKTSSIQEIIDLQESEFRNRIRLVEVKGGGRSRPLNESLSRGRGRYFAFFDDDDLVFGNWVETFREHSNLHPGRLLRAIASTQRMEPEVWSDGTAGFRSTTWPKAEYLPTFEIERHLERNHTPFMSVAFPRELFELWGEQFDEELEVCEDWDMILRGAFLLGVISAEELTVVYRLWEGITSSYTEHDLESWRQSEARVRSKINGRPTVLPEGSASSIIESLRESEVRVSSNTQLNAVLTSSSWRLTAPVRWGTRMVRRGLQRLRRGSSTGVE